MKKLFVAITILIGFAAQAETYSFDFNDLYEAIKSYDSKISPTSGINVTLQGVDWHIDIEKMKDESARLYVKQRERSGEVYCVSLSHYLQRITFTSNSFAGVKINSITVHAGGFSDDCTDLVVNDQPGVSTACHALSQPVTIDGFLCDETLSFDFIYTQLAFDRNDTSFEFAEIVIDYGDSGDVSEGPMAPALALEPGTRFSLIANSDEMIYCSIDGDEFEPYYFDEGIAVPDVDFTFSYYSEVKGQKSEVVTILITRNLVEPFITVSEAVARHTYVTVRGVICDRDENATYLTEETSSFAADAEPARIAVDHSELTELKSASIGKTVEVTGKISDKFGVPSLSSVTGMYMDGVATEIKSLPEKKQGNDMEEKYYNLKGERLRTPSNSAPYIRCTPNGARLFIR